MRKNRKLACAALTVSILSGILGIVYLIALGVMQTGLQSISPLTGNLILNAAPVLSVLGLIMLISTLIMILALPVKRHRL